MNVFLKSCLAILILAISVAETAWGKTSEAADIEELKRLEKIWNDAHLRGDIEAMDRLWASDLVVTAPDLPIMNKDESLGVWRGGRMKFDIYKTSDLRIKVYGDAAVVTGQLERIRDSKSKEFQDDWRFTKVYVRRGGRWQVVAWHGSHVGTS